MKRRIAACLTLLLILSGQKAIAAPADRFSGQYEYVFESPLLRVDTGGGSGQYLSLAEKNGMVAFIRQDQPDSNGANLGLFDLNQGRLTAQTALPEIESGSFGEISFLDDGGILLMDQSQMTLLHFDRELKETLRFAVPEGESYYAAFAEKGGQYLYCAAEERLVRFTLPGSEKKTIPLGLPKGWLFSSFAGERDGQVLCVITGPDGLSVTGAIDRKGNIHLTTIPASFSWLNDGHIMLSGRQEALIGTLPHSGVFSRVSAWSDTDYPYAWQDSLLLIGSWDDEKPLRLMDLDQGTLVNQLLLAGKGDTLSFGYALLSEDGFALIGVDDYEQQSFFLCLWDYSKDPLNAPGGVTRVTMADIRRELDQKAARVAEKYGISIHIRQDGASFENDTYQGRLMEDELRLGDALDELDAFFSLLPSGMPGEALIPPYTRFGIYLCGEIIPKNAGGIASASGIASSDGEERYIALNARDSSFLRNLAHEFMHVMEDRLWENHQGIEESLLGQWGRLGPAAQEGHGFAFSYHNPDMTEWADGSFTAEDGQAQENPDEVWFIDAYSRTFPLEDRARIFENLFTAGDTTGSLFFYPNLLLKAQCLSAIIRNAFPSVQALPKASWEQLIGQVPYETLYDMIMEMLPAEEELPAAG